MEIVAEAYGVEMDVLLEWCLVDAVEIGESARRPVIGPVSCSPALSNRRHEWSVSGAALTDRGAWRL
jgi:hypothetical protein